MQFTMNRPLIVTLTATALLGTAVIATAQRGRDRDSSRSPVHRGVRPPLPPADGGVPLDAPPADPMSAADFPAEFRTIDGVDNNLLHADWGAAGVHLKRVAAADYADGSGAPSGGDRLSARAISNIMAAQSEDLPNGMNASDYLWQWGQFLDHDIDETPVTDPGEAFDIHVPTGDPWFDPRNTGTVTIPLDRSAFAMVDGVRQQFNNITAFIDASNVYGSEHDRGIELRTMDGTGRLKVQNTAVGDLLPLNVNGFDNAPSSAMTNLFLAGDIRANEQAGLAAMHTLFVREHNHWAGEIAADDPMLSGDEIYEHARAIVAAEMQAITYREFLPVLLGPNALSPYQGYDPDVDPGISNVFATAAYRVGHTMLSETILRLDAQGNEVAAGHLSLADAFFDPTHLNSEGIDSILRGLANQRSQAIDNKIIDNVRNFLFGPPGAGGFDLASLNIQRGRDHGLPSYNDVRQAFGRPRADSFNEVSPDPQVRAALAEAYDHPGQIDAWVGLLAERHRPGAMVGKTLHRVLRDQFERLRDGDRFWYEGYLPPPMVRMIEQQTLATIIRRNTDIGNELQNDVFRVPPGPPPCAGDLDGDGGVGVEDMLAMLNAWGPCNDCPADLNDDGVVGVEDMLGMLNGWGPCPAP